MDKNPNIVIIIIDALRTKNLSLYGYEKETDSNLKKLAKEGILFKQHFSVSNSSVPSLTSLFTGKFPNNHGIIHQFPYTTQKEIEKLKTNKFWFPLYLKRKGYSTIGIDWIGAWLKRGFDFYADKEESKSQNFLKKEFIKKILLNLPNWAYKLGKKIYKKRSSSLFPPANKTMDLAISKIQNSKKPFFLFMHFEDTHFPFPTVKYKGTGKNEINDILNQIKENSQKEYIKKRITDISLYSIEDIKNKYELAIKFVDSQVGRLINFLKKQNKWENTIFVVMADHGENLGEHNIYFSHAGLYDDAIKVPLIMKMPGFRNIQVNEMVQNIDIIPTILDYMDEKTNLNLDGISMTSLIKTGVPIRKKILAFDGLAEDVKAVRTKNKKSIISKNKKCYLCKSSHHQDTEEYDLENDPNELENIYSSQ